MYNYVIIKFLIYIIYMDNKFKQLLKVSDPEIVEIKARQYFKTPKIELYLSLEKNKNYSI